VQPLIILADLPCDLGQQDEVERPRQRLSRRRDGLHAPAELRQASLALALHGQRPATPAGPISPMEWKTLRGRQGHEGLGLRLDRQHVAAAVMQVSRPVGIPITTGGIWAIHSIKAFRVKRFRQIMAPVFSIPTTRNSCLAMSIPRTLSCGMGLLR
jgi:hypothetical protein